MVQTNQPATLIQPEVLSNFNFSQATCVALAVVGSGCTRCPAVLASHSYLAKERYTTAIWDHETKYQKCPEK